MPNGLAWFNRQITIGLHFVVRRSVERVIDHNALLVFFGNNPLPIRRIKVLVVLISCAVANRVGRIERSCAFLMAAFGDVFVCIGTLDCRAVRDVDNLFCS